MADIKQNIVIGATDNTTRGMRSAQNKLTAFDRTLKRVQTTMLGFVGINIAAHLIQGLAQASDTAVELAAKVDLMTDSTEEFNLAQSDLLAISLESGSSLEANTILFTRMNKAIKALGGDTQETLDLTRLMSQGLRISGASAQESTSVVRQFSQAMASGVLRGEEFNSIMENGGRVAIALADGIGVPIGKLREMSKAGELSAERVKNALLSQSEVLATENAKLPLTIGRALENVNSKWLSFLQDMGSANATAAGLINGLAENFDQIAIAIGVAAKASLLFFSAKAIAAYTSKLDNLSKKYTEAAVAAKSASSAKVAADRAEIASVEYKINAKRQEQAAETKAIADLARREVVTTQLAVVETKAAMARAENHVRDQLFNLEKLKMLQSELAAQIRIETQLHKIAAYSTNEARIAGAMKLSAMNKELEASTLLVAKAEASLTASRTALSVSTNKYTAAMGVNLTAQKAMTAATVTATAAATKANTSYVASGLAIDKIGASAGRSTIVLSGFTRASLAAQGALSGLTTLGIAAAGKLTALLRGIGSAIFGLPGILAYAGYEITNHFVDWGLLVKAWEVTLRKAWAWISTPFDTEARSAQLKKIDAEFAAWSDKRLGEHRKVSLSFEDAEKQKQLAAEATANIVEQKALQQDRVFTKLFKGMVDRGLADTRYLVEQIHKNMDSLGTVKGIQELKAQIEVAMEKAGADTEAFTAVLGELEEKERQVLVETGKMAAALKAANDAFDIETIATTTLEFEKLVKAMELVDEEFNNSEISIDSHQAAVTKYLNSYRQYLVENQGVAESIADTIITGEAAQRDMQIAISKTGEVAVITQQMIKDTGLAAAETLKDDFKELEDLQKESMEATVNVFQAGYGAITTKVSAAYRQAALTADAAHKAMEASKAAMVAASITGDAELLANATETYQLDLDAYKDAVKAKIDAAKLANTQAKEAAKAAVGAETKAKREAAKAEMDASDEALANHIDNEEAKAESTEFHTAQVSAAWAKTYNGVIEGARFAGNAGYMMWVGIAQRAADAAEQAYNKGVEAVNNYTEALTAAEWPAQDVIAAATVAQSRFKDLGDEELKGLRDALEDANKQIEDLRDSALDTLSKLRVELANIRGDTVQAENIEYERDRKELEEELAIARESGDAKTIAAMEESLRILRIIHDENLANIAAEVEAQAARDAEEAAAQLEREAAEAIHEQEMHDERLANIAEENEARNWQEAGPGTGFATGGYVSGPGTGTSDSIAAKLSNGEFVMNAKTVARFGVDALRNMQKWANSPFKFAEGGSVPGTGLGDTVKALLTPGEFVMKKSAVNQFGSEFFNSINQGVLPKRFANGGLVGAAGALGSSETIDVNLSIGGKSAVGTFAKSDATMAVIDELKRVGAGS